MLLTEGLFHIFHFCLFPRHLAPRLSLHPRHLRLPLSDKASPPENVDTNCGRRMAAACGHEYSNPKAFNEKNGGGWKKLRQSPQRARVNAISWACRTHADGVNCTWDGLRTWSQMQKNVLGKQPQSGTVLRTPQFPRWNSNKFIQLILRVKSKRYPGVMASSLITTRNSKTF